MPGVPSGDNRSDVRDFLISRRARLRPEQVGMPAGGRRRVAGLRRAEVAVLAGVSVEWYTRLEKGHIAGVSDEVLDAVARALRLGRDERVYLFGLARAARPNAHRGPRQRPDGLPREVGWLLDAMTMSAALVTDGRLDVLAANALARALYAPMFGSATTAGRGGANVAVHLFRDPGARDFYVDWAGAAAAVVALLRAEAGRHPRDAGLSALVEELRSVSEEFRALWETHDVRIVNRGVKAFRPPGAGPIELSYFSFGLPDTAGPSVLLTAYTAEPGSAAEERLAALAG